MDNVEQKRPVPLRHSELVALFVAPTLALFSYALLSEAPYWLFGVVAAGLLLYYGLIVAPGYLLLRRKLDMGLVACLVYYSIAGMVLGLVVFYGSHRMEVVAVDVVTFVLPWTVLGSLQWLISRGKESSGPMAG
ncbi:MAG: hypothetical protein ACK50D_12790 [Burkholderiales bacterium]